MMTIAIDYDGTWTRDPWLWEHFTALAKQAGHTVVIATGRKESQPVPTNAIPWNMRVIYCDRDYKESILAKCGIKVDIWVDDMPGMIQQTKILGGNL